MAYTTPIGADPAQVDYRLYGRHGCTAGAAHEQQFSYRADGRERPLRWIGEGLREVGIRPGAELTGDQFDTARALMNGLDPRTGERLVAHKLAVFDDAKVPLAPLVAAVRQMCRETARTPIAVLGTKRMADMYQRAERAVAAIGEAAGLRADHAGQIADAAGVPVAVIWGEEAFRTALANLTQPRTVTGTDGVRAMRQVPRRRVVGNLGYDVSFTLPKSYSLLLAFADESTAAQIERLYTEQVTRTFEWLEQATCYGMRGHHGDGRIADTVAGSGFLGWTMVHRAARPVDGAPVGDPHWHVHISLANMTRGQDGKWSTVAAGGRDLMRHVPAADKILQALVRHRLHEDLGVEFVRSPRTGLWEVAAIPDETLRLFSRRGASIDAFLADLGFNAAEVPAGMRRAAKIITRERKTTEATGASDATLREIWQQRTRDAGTDPEALAAQALHHTASRTTTSPAAGGETLLADVVRALSDPETGLTAHARRFSRVDALAAVADQLPAGAADITDIETLTDQVLAHAAFVPLGTFGTAAAPAGARGQLGASHMSNAGRYTTADVVAAERLILRRVHQAVDNPTACVRVSDAQARMAISTAEAAQGYPLSQQQQTAVRRIVTSGRAIDTMAGGPGCGKTATLRAARIAWQAAGLVVAGTATQGTTGQNLAAQSGIEALTVAQWLWRIHHGRGLSGVDVLVLDEAAMTDDRARAVFYQEAERSGTKLVEIGDPKQLRGVGCGSLFARIHEILGGPELTENRRQVEEDERAILASWRAGRYAAALTGWSRRGRLVATETGQEALAALVATWIRARQGAPDPHAELDGLAVLAATNGQVDRANQAIQAVRNARGELGPARTYTTGAGQLRLHVGDHVALRLTARRQRLHSGPDVYNGYRGVVESIAPDGTVVVSYDRDSGDGPIRETARLSRAYIAQGGLDLGYAMTIHRSQGLTIAGSWPRPDGSTNAGTVLVYGAGADAPGFTVALSRHRGQLLLFLARQELETPQHSYLHGVPATNTERMSRVIAAVATHATATAENANDRPAVADLGEEPSLADQVRDATALRTARGRDDTADQAPADPTEPPISRPSPTPSEPRPGRGPHQ